jgi:hypothetical protein
MPSVSMDKKTGRPTAESLKTLLHEVSKKAGHLTRVEATYVKDDNFQKMVDSAEKRMKQNSDPKRESYGLFTNNCATFCQGILESGGENTPSMLDPRPNSYIDELQSHFGNRISYDPKSNKLEVKNGE